MGGINCKAVRIDEVSPELRTAYVESLALYSGTLFQGTSDFFEANAKIEEAVLNDGSIQEAVELLKAGENAFALAQEQLGTVSSLWTDISTNDTQVDFREQLDALGLAANSVATARMDLELLASSESLQGSLWADPALTSNFVQAMESVNSVTAWQGKFSLSTSLIVA